VTAPRATVALCAMLAASSTIESAGPTADTPGYRIAGSVALSDPPGKIEVLEDERLSPKMREKWRGGDAATFCAPPPADPAAASLCASIKERALRGAIVRLVDGTGTVLDRRAFARELVDVSPAKWYEAPRHVTAVTADFGVGFGSYSGLTTFFVERNGAQLHWLETFDVAAGKTTELALTRTLKSDWQPVKRADAHGADILAVRCHPDLPRTVEPDRRELPFVIIYERYTFDGARWVRKERKEPGFWESDRGFPSRDKFPP
jgi:hypothetical protein